MKKFLLHISKYGLMVFLLLNVISYANLYFLKNSSFYKPEFLTHEIKQKSFDYIIIGSSVGLTSLNTKQIDSLTNKNGLNLSIDDTATSSNYLMLQHFFEQGGKTKFCFLVVNYWDLSDKNPQLSNNDYRFLPFVSEKYVFDYYKNLEKGFFKPLTWSHYFPMFGVGYYNTELFYPSLVALFRPSMRNRFDDKGNYSYPISIGVNKIKNSFVKLSWENPYIDKIDKLCEKNNTKLIIYQAPIYKITIINTNLKYVFINNSDAIVDENLFYNEIHLNFNGRKKCSNIFAEEMIKNYFNK